VLARVVEDEEGEVKRVNGHQPKSVVIREKYVPAPGEVEWAATRWSQPDPVTGFNVGIGIECRIHAQTWFMARAQAMARLNCEAHEVEVKRA
jgi:hypothetical protein